MPLYKPACPPLRSLGAGPLTTALASFATGKVGGFFIRAIAIAACLITISQIPVVLANEANTVSEDDLQAVLEQLSAVQQHLSKDVQRYGELDSDFANTEKAIGKLARERHALRNTLRTIQRELESKDAELVQLEQQLAAEQASIGEQIRLAYQLGSRGALQLLLQQTDPADISRRLTWLDYANAARVEEIEQFRASLDAVTTLRRQLDNKRQDAATTQQQLQQRDTELSATQTKRKKQLLSLRKTIEGREQQVKSLQADSEHLSELLRQVEETLARQQSITPPGDFAGNQRKLDWPVQGKLLYRFGTSRPNSDVNWQGVTIAAEEGSDVRAIYPGRVVFSDWFRGQGLLLILDHGDGYMSLYGHNQSLLRETGAWVSAGEAIATVGNSGGQSRSALYFEIRHNGQARNPDKWCQNG